MGPGTLSFTSVGCFGATLGPGDDCGEACPGVDIFRDDGGVDSADDINEEAELKIDEPKPNIFPVTDSVALDSGRA